MESNCIKENLKSCQGEEGQLYKDSEMRAWDSGPGPWDLLL